MFKVIINFFAVIIIILIFNNSLYSQSLELLKEIDISKEVVKKENWKHLQIFSSDKQRIGNYFAINLNKLIVSNIDKLKISDYLSVIILLETIDGSCLVTTIEDFKIINNKIIPYLLIKEANRQPFIPKTLKDTEIEGDVNLTPLENDLFAKTLIYLRFKDRNPDNLKKRWKENTVIFPYDLSSERWYSGIKSIKILRIRSDNKKIN